MKIQLSLLLLLINLGRVCAQQTPTGQLLSFAFLKANNPGLTQDVGVTGNIESYNVVTLPTGTGAAGLKATFTASAGAKVTVGGVIQSSSTSANNFSQPVVYRITAPDGTTRDYTIEASMQTDIAALDNAVGAFMTKYDLPGLSIAIVKNERLVYAKGYGLADKEKGTPVTNNSLFRVGSVSKTITALGALKLVDEGKLNLDQTVFGKNGILGTTYGTQPYTPQLEQITTRQLLSHTAGGDAWNHLWNYPVRIDPFYQPEWLGYTQAQVLSATIDTRPVTQTPGSKMVYSNVGFSFAGRVIEKASGVGYEKYVQDNLLKPIGIDPATMRIAGGALTDRVANEVVYYNPYPGYDQPYDFAIPRLDSPGGWATTAINMARLLASTDGVPGRKDILSGPRVQEMLTPSKASLDQLGGATGFGYGLGSYVLSTNKTSTHDGGLSGTSATWWRYPSGYTYVVLVNTRRNEASYYPDLEGFLNTALFSGTPYAGSLLMKGDQFDTYFAPTVSSQATYCTPTQRDIYSCASGDGTIGIDAVKIWSPGKVDVLLDSKGVCSQNGNAYSDLTSRPATKLTRGGTFPFQVDAMRIQTGTSKGSIYINPVSIWVDLDQNNVFTNDERLYYTTSSQSYPNPTLISQFVIPATAKTGTTRLRIRLGSAFTGMPETPCEQIDGETEDHAVEILNNCPLVVSLVASPSAVCQGNSTTLTASATGLQGTPTYAWQVSGAPIASTSPTLSASVAGTYSVTVSDASGCSVVGNSSLIINPMPLPAILGKLSFCTGQATSLSATTTVGAAPFSYQWQLGTGKIGIGATLPVSTTGAYLLTITDRNGCVGSTTAITVAEDPMPTVTITGNPYFCTGQTTSLTGVVAGGTGPYTQQWRRNAELISTVSSLTVNTIGAYSAMVIDSKGCQSSTAISVTEARSPVPAITGNTTICAGQSTPLSATSTLGTGPFAVVWQRDQTGSGTGNPLVATLAGNYVAVLTDAKGCVGTSASFSLTQKPAPDAQITPSADGLNLLPGGSVVLTANTGPGLTYQWKQDANTLTGATSASYAAQQAGTYTVSVSRDGCFANSAGVVVLLITATEPTPTDGSLSVTPNPTSGQISIRLRLANPATATFIVRDVAGRIVRQWPVLRMANYHELATDLSALPAGVYLITAETGSQRYVQRVVHE